MIYLLLCIVIAVFAVNTKKLLGKIGSLNQDLQSLKKYQPIVDVEAEVTKRRCDLNIELENKINHVNQEVAQRQAESQSLESRLRLLNDEFTSLDKRMKALTESSELIEAGFYQSKYDFDNSKKYEDRLEQIRQKQKDMIKDKVAIICRTEWSVGDSRAEGKKMTERTIKLGLSAFNVQCDNEILKVKFNNIDRATEKIHKIKETVNKLLEPNHCEIMAHFVELKLQELYLAYEYQQKVHEEKEEQKALREQMREEEKARKEAERAEAEALREEKRYEAALEKARLELDGKTENERALFLAKIAELEFKLKEAQDNKERAKSLAELTRMGHVYIISNIGSFGENVFKIGMTRRLDPMDRVYELSDASVPFEFDVHAMIKSDDAPSLEKKLHEKFTKKRMNRMNPRKEFFRATLVEIEDECKKIHQGEFKLTKLAEAKEYRQTIALLSCEDKKDVA